MTQTRKHDPHTVDIWDQRDISNALGISRSMSYNLLHTEGVPSFRIGNRLFVHRELFLEWLKKQAEAK